MTNEKVSEEFILFPEANVEGIILKPWTFGVLLDVNPFIEAIFLTLEAKGIVLDRLSIGFKEIQAIYFAAAPQLLRVIVLSTGKDEEYLRNLDLKIIIKLVYVIWNQNSENLKNALSLFDVSASGETLPVS